MKEKCLKITDLSIPVDRKSSAVLSGDQWRSQTTLIRHRLVNVTTRIWRNLPASHSWQSEVISFSSSIQRSRAVSTCLQTCWKFACWVQNILLPSEYWLRRNLPFWDISSVIFVRISENYAKSSLLPRFTQRTSTRCKLLLQALPNEFCKVVYCSCLS